MDDPPAANGKTLTGMHVLLWMLGFFGLIFAVNGVFLYHAINSFPGEDVKNSYVQGLNYNDTLAARAAQAQLGWQAQAGLQDGHVVIRLTSRDGTALSGYRVVAQLRRPANVLGDVVLTLAPQGEGRYAQSVNDLQPGWWQAEFTVLDHDGETPIFTARKDLELE